MPRPGIIFSFVLFVLFVGALLAPATHVPLVSAPASAAMVQTTIAYVRPNDTMGDEIRLIEPTGTGDRLIWQIGKPDDYQIEEIGSLAWRPDAGELAFDSDHEGDCSFYETDIYAIRPDGSGYRRITQSPACAALARYPKGTVHVPGINHSFEPVFPYIQGAPGVKMVTSSSAMVTFENVADFGEGVMQAVVVIGGGGRWLDPVVVVDVVPGGEITTPAFTVSGSPFPDFGASGPSWHPDGAALAYVFSSSQMEQISANPPPLADGAPLMREGTKTPLSASHIEWGPTPATAGQFLYVGGGDESTAIYLATAGSTSAGQRLLSFEEYDLVAGLAWLPDGSGFVYTVSENFLEQSNVYRYDFATQAATRLTNFTDEYAAQLTVSPDGRQIVFERGMSWLGLPTDLDRSDLWIMNHDGRELKRLVENARSPAWSPGEPRLPSEQKIYLPAIMR